VPPDATVSAEQPWSAARLLWTLEPGVAHLNHGSFGAVPLPVQRAQQRLRDEAEANPTKFHSRGLMDRLAHVRRYLASFLGADPDRTAFVPNASAGVSAVLASLPLRADDEVLLTDHAYGAVLLAVERACELSGARPVVRPIPLGAAPDEVVAEVSEGIGPRTRLLVIDQIASATARLFPVAELVAAAHERDVPVLVDAAHAPGMLPVRVDDLQADFWVGNLHKWGCAPRGTAVLMVGPQWRTAVRTATVSWWEPDGFPRSFDYPGTVDFTSWLAAPVGLHTLGSFGWEALRARNAALAAHGQRTLADALGVDGADLVGDDTVSMRVVPLPPGVAATPEDAIVVRDRIAGELRAEVNVNAWNGQGLLRVSGQAYNGCAEYEELADQLPMLLRRMA
jgi:isopenicillin-N epimerase